MSTTVSSPVPSLYIWPRQWGLASFDPLCLAAVSYLQIAIPGKFTVTETSNPDSSPTGQLPFLIHGQHTVTSFPSIVKYIAGLRNAEYKTFSEADLDTHLTQRERSQKIAWLAHSESHLGDLVYHSMYSNQDNWSKLTAAALGSMYHVPQKYYVPRRIRDSYHQRLSASGLWQQFTEDSETSPQSPFSKEAKTPTKKELAKNPALSKAFNKEKVLEKARPTLDAYKEILGNDDFIFNNRLSTLDIIVASHILLLTEVPYPDSTIKELITTGYPSLHSHSQRVYAVAFGQGQPITAGSSPTSSLWSIVPTWPKKVSILPSSEDVTPEDLQYRKARLAFIGLAVGTLVTYLAIAGSQVLTIQWLNASEHNRVDQEDDI